MLISHSKNVLLLQCSKIETVTKSFDSRNNGKVDFYCQIFFRKFIYYLLKIILTLLYKLYKKISHIFVRCHVLFLELRKPPILEVFIINIFHNIIISPCR